MSVNHYENFPVASILLPRRLRPAVHAIYAFARTADDLADEGIAAPQDRLSSLQAYEEALDGIEQGHAQDLPLFIQLAKAVREYDVPIQPMRDLLSAFKQDVITTRYPTFETLLDYCRRSADPVGRLMLHLYGATSEKNVRDSDCICSALQLINFWQDVAIDWKKSRIYLPQEDMMRFGVTTAHLNQGRVDDAWRALMQFEVKRARDLMLSGADLALRLPGRVGWELRLVIQGGLRILEAIEAVDYDVFRRRPQLHALDWVRLGWRALCMKIRLAPNAQVG